MPILMHSCESWVLTGGLMDRVETCEMRVLRMLEGSRKCCEAIRQRLGESQVLQKNRFVCISGWHLARIDAENVLEVKSEYNNTWNFKKNMYT